MTVYTHVNNGGEDVFYVVGAVYITSMKPVPNNSDSWEVGQFSTSKYQEKWIQWISDAARSTQTG
jgi:hypothetical protein